MRLKRVEQNPILTPRPEVEWESGAVFNTAVVYDRGAFHLLYRAVKHPNYSSIGYAKSADGIHFERLNEPVLVPGVPEEKGGVEDPRVTKIGETFYMLYTAWNGEWDGQVCQVALATSNDLLHWEKRGIVLGYDLFGNNKDAALFPERIGGKYVMIHRPIPNIWISYSEDPFSWKDHVCIMERQFEWEAKKIGAAGPPIKTDKGWLFIYHGVDERSVYRLGIALLDLNDPTIVLKRQAEPILEPEESWELQGDVPNVVFSCGALLFDRDLWVYFAGADKVIGLAKGNVGDFLNS